MQASSEYTDEKVDLEVYLINGKKVTLKVEAFDRSDQVLEVGQFFYGTEKIAPSMVNFSQYSKPVLRLVSSQTSLTTLDCTWRKRRPLQAAPHGSVSYTTHTKVILSQSYQTHACVP